MDISFTVSTGGGAGKFNAGRSFKEDVEECFHYGYSSMALILRKESSKLFNFTQKDLEGFAVTILTNYEHQNPEKAPIDEKGKKELLLSIYNGVKTAVEEVETFEVKAKSEYQEFYNKGLKQGVNICRSKDLAFLLKVAESGEFSDSFTLEIASKFYQEHKLPNGVNDQSANLEKYNHFAKGIFDTISTYLIEFKKGADLAVKFCALRKNFNDLHLVFNDRSKLDALIDTSLITPNTLRAKYTHLIVEPNGRKSEVFETQSFENCLKGIKQEINTFFLENAKIFEKQNMSVEALAELLDEKPVEAKKKKKKKASKKISPSTNPQESKVEEKPKSKPVVVEAPTKKELKAPKESADEKRGRIAEQQIKNFEETVAKVIKAGVSHDSYNQLDKIVNEQRSKVEGMQTFYNKLTEETEMAKSRKALEAAQHILEKFEQAFSKVARPNPRRVGRYGGNKSDNTTAAAENLHTAQPVLPKPDILVGNLHTAQPAMREPGLLNEFTVHIRTVMGLLNLTNTLNHPIDLDGKYTDPQMQTFKICVLYLINCGYFFYTVPQENLHYVASELCKALPDNKFTPKELYNGLMFNSLEVFSVLAGAGFKFSA